LDLDLHGGYVYVIEVFCEMVDLSGFVCVVDFGEDDLDLLWV